ncbi:hypothetical protein HUT19_01360 [Streptomyces sp. NA02950]|uniref:hypothetical protein n=1 Tax=Streptomyces sp. NA02950 TaxID=2742137 RepID=UPI0015902399|nr:hypothetical protein [Streptomyces sp. NA02950]QKV90579.1 hypothetical protein HUT19_01360 [Streptomyces sp. NA02950]
MAAAADGRERLPSEQGAHCRYIEEWMVVRARWGLAVDPAEQTSLTALAADCRNTTITCPSDR